jgi:hypothetical protein
MTVKYLVKFPFSVAIPEEIAKSTPGFPFDEFQAEPLITSSGQVILLNNELDSAVFDSYIQAGHDPVEYYPTFDNQLIATCHQDGDYIVGTVEFDDADPFPDMFIDDTEPFGVIVTPITA